MIHCVYGSFERSVSQGYTGLSYRGMTKMNPAIPARHDAYSDHDDLTVQLSFPLTWYSTLSHRNTKPENTVTYHKTHHLVGP